VNPSCACDFDDEFDWDSGQLSAAVGLARSLQAPKA